MMNCQVMRCCVMGSWATGLGAETSCASPRQTQQWKQTNDCSAALYDGVTRKQAWKNRFSKGILVGQEEGKAEKPRLLASLEVAQGRHGDGGRKGALGRLLAALESVHKHFDGLAGIGRDKNRGLEKAVLDPGLAGLGQAVAAEKRQAKPALFLGVIGQLFKSFARADGHGIVLSSDEVNRGFARSGELEPGADGFLRAFLGPLGAEKRGVDAGGLGFLHSGGAVFGGGILRRSLDTKNGTALREQRSDLAALNAADFEMVRCDDKNRSGGGLAKLCDINGVAIENGPADPGGGRSAGNLGQGGTADRFKNNGLGAMRFFGLNGFQKLGALGDGVVVRVNHLELDAEFAGSGFGRLRLLDLVIVVVGCERNEKTQFFHSDTRPCLTN